jgi:arylsulfatase A-like enzyme
VSGSVLANPLYSNRALDNFHIGSNSPCYSTSGDIAQSVDAAGTPTDAEALNLRPNVLFIVADDQRFAGTLAYMPKTMRWFVNGNAASGMVGGTEFTNAFVTTPLCCPSRTSIMTGQYVHNHRVRLEDTTGTPFSQDANNTQDDNYPTIQRYLDGKDPAKDLNYQNAIFGKYLNGWDPCAQSPEPVQPPHFERYAIFRTGAYLNFAANDQGTYYGCGPGTAARISEYSNSWISNRARSFITQTESNDSMPWFMYIAPTAPHTSSGTGGEGAPVPEPGKYDPASYPSSAFGTPGSTPAL